MTPLAPPPQAYASISDAYLGAIPGGAVDEAVLLDGTVRPPYAEALGALTDLGLDHAARLAGRAAREAGLAIGPREAARPLPVDPVPRILTATEWATLAAGLAQRARALDALVADAYGERRAVAAGAVPAEVLDSCPYFEPQLAGAPAPPFSVGVAGFDVVRGPDGRLAVLEDNLLTPGHVAAAAARDMLGLSRRVRSPPVPVRDLTLRALRAMLTAAGGGAAAILADDPAGATTWELRWLARLLGIPVVGLGEGRARGDRVVDADGRTIDVLWQRTSEDRLRHDDGRPTALGDVLLPALRAGTIRVVNRIGCGVADDKRASRHVDAVIRVLLGEEPLLPSVPLLDLGSAEQRARALDDPARYVFKPRNGAGGRLVTFGADVGGAALRALRATLDGEPRGWVAQRRIALSTHPTVAGGVLEPRRADHRAFAVRGRDGYTILPGVSRYAPNRRALLVNTSQGGGVKDVWVLPG